MFRQINTFLLKITGWKIKLGVNSVPKCVISVAPHTSNWDFVVGKMLCSAIGYKVSFLMKKEWFFFPLNYILKAMGGIPVNRGKKGQLTELLVEEFNRREHFQLVVTPEGTRKPNAEWKKGFYYIALGADIPIALAYIDFKKKEAGIPRYFYPTGDVEKDMQEIKDFYKQFTGKNPDNFAV